MSAYVHTVYWISIPHPSASTEKIEQTLSLCLASLLSFPIWLVQLSLLQLSSCAPPTWQSIWSSPAQSLIQSNEHHLLPDLTSPMIFSWSTSELGSVCLSASVSWSPLPAVPETIEPAMTMEMGAPLVHVSPSPGSHEQSATPLDVLHEYLLSSYLQLVPVCINCGHTPHRVPPPFPWCPTNSWQCLDQTHQHSMATISVQSLLGCFVVLLCCCCISANLSSSDVHPVCCDLVWVSGTILLGLGAAFPHLWYNSTLSVSLFLNAPCPTCVMERSHSLDFPFQLPLYESIFKEMFSFRITCDSVELAVVYLHIDVVALWSLFPTGLTTLDLTPDPGHCFKIKPKVVSCLVGSVTNCPKAQLFRLFRIVTS